MCYSLPYATTDALSALSAYSAVGPSPYLSAPLAHKCLANVSQVSRQISTPSYEITINDNK